VLSASVECVCPAGSAQQRSEKADHAGIRDDRCLHTYRLYLVCVRQVLDASYKGSLKHEPLLSYVSRDALCCFARSPVISSKTSYPFGYMTVQLTCYRTLLLHQAGDTSGSLVTGGIPGMDMKKQSVL
jgi:hypothetical protein